LSTATVVTVRHPPTPAREAGEVSDPADPGPPRPGARSGSAYVVVPDAGAGPGVLLLHSWWGLTPTVKSVVGSLADAGYTALAPDLLHGELPADAAEARDLLVASDPNRTAALVLDSTVALRAHSSDPEAPVAVVGFAMGASWGLWLATRQPDSVRAVVAYYGTQNIDFTALRSPILGHFAEEDPLVGEDELVEMQAHLLLLDKHVEVHRYPGTGHGFAEDTPAAPMDAESADLAWERTLAFLAEHHPAGGTGPAPGA
jgi:carboxymethylenebutenolidase